MYRLFGTVGCLLAIVLFGIPVLGVLNSFSDPPDVGTGAYVNGGRAALAWAGLICGLVTGVGCLIAARSQLYDDPGLGVAGVAVGVLMILFGLGSGADLFLGPDEDRLTTTGFSSPNRKLNGGGEVMYRNLTHRPLRLCVGRAADCTTIDGAPARLQSPGVTLPPNSFVVVKFRNADNDFPLTTVDTSGRPALPDATVHVDYQAPST